MAKDPSRADVNLDLRFADAIHAVTSALDSGAGENKLNEWVAATAN
jgi:hypothetical protein